MNNEDSLAALTLKVPLGQSFSSVLISFVTEGARSFGLGERETGPLALAVEGLFSYLCGEKTATGPLEVKCTSGRYYIAVRVSFASGEFNFRPVNITSTIGLDDDSRLDNLELFLTSHLVDSFRVSQKKDGHYEILLIKEKSYPPAPEGTAPPSSASGEFVIRPAGTEDLKLLSQLVRSHYNEVYLKQDFEYPGKIVDMVQGGDYRALIAIDHEGHLGGGLLWHAPSPRIAECIGPYIFNQNHGPRVAEALIEGCLGALARTLVLGIIVYHPSLDEAFAHFEHLAMIEMWDNDGTRRPMHVFFRQIGEDQGAVVFAHPAIEEFLNNEYERLVCPRKLRLLRDAGETKHKYSSLSCQMSRSEGWVFIAPQIYGSDAAENLDNHLKLFKKEKMKNIFFHMDLAHHWQVEFTPALLSRGFRPKYIIPHGGDLDMMIFQWEQGLQ
jgi:hypothetical protein